MKNVLVIITGTPYSGKSTLSKLLCRRTGWLSLKVGITSEAASGFISGEMLNCGAIGDDVYALRKSDLTSKLQESHTVVVADPEGRDQIIEYAESVGITVLPVFISNPTNVTAKRLLDHVASSLLMNISNPTPTLLSLTDRIDRLLSEGVSWMPSDHGASIAFGLFNADVEDMVVGRIAAYVDRLSS